MKPSFTPYSEKQKKNWGNSRSIVICETEKQIRKFVSDARKGTNIGKKMYLGAIPASLAETIRIEPGLNVEGYNCSVAAQEIRKIFKDHGNEQTENLREQRTITEYDFVNIPVVIQSPDKITRSERDYNGRPVINFVKLLEGKVTVTAYVSGKHLALTVQTLFAGINHVCGHKNRNLATPTGEQAPVNTPEANSGTVPDNSIPTSSEKSKGKIKASAVGRDYDYKTLIKKPDMHLTVVNDRVQYKPDIGGCAVCVERENRTGCIAAKDRRRGGVDLMKSTNRDRGTEVKGGATVRTICGA